MVNEQFTVLILDDQAIEVRLMESILRRQGMEVLWADTPERADRILSQLCPHLIFADINLGTQLTGLDWLRKVRESEFDFIPRVVMSASKQMDDVKAAMALGAIDYILKPADHQVLTKKIAAFKKRMIEQPLYQLNFSQGAGIRCLAAVDCELAALGEIGVAFGGPISASAPCEVEIESSFFSKEKIAAPAKVMLMQSLPESNRKKIGHATRSYCRVTDWNEEDRKTIRAFIQARGLKRGEM